MTQDEIIKMVRKSGWTNDFVEMSFILPKFEAFAKLVAAKAIAELQSQEPVALQYPQKDIDWQREQQIKAHTKLDDDDIQVYQKPWVDMTPEDYAEIFVTARRL